MIIHTKYPRDILVDFRKLDDESLKRIIRYLKCDIPLAPVPSLGASSSGGGTAPSYTDALLLEHDELAAYAAHLFRRNTGTVPI